MTEWQPMQTAPKDGTKINGMFPDGIERTMSFRGKCWCGFVSPHPAYEGIAVAALSFNEQYQPMQWKPCPTPSPASP